jgi:hypothetical protein
MDNGWRLTLVWAFLEGNYGSSECQLEVMHSESDIDIKPQRPLSSEVDRDLASFIMDDVDRKLR